MSFFCFKISDPNSLELVESIKGKSQDFTIQQLNQLESDLVIGSKVFIQLGGDKVKWNKGLIGLAEIIREPYDKGYDEKNARNFRLGLKMLLVLQDVIKREEFRFYVDAYDAGGIGPNTKGEQNQAIKSLTDSQACAIIRAMAEKENQLEEEIKNIFDSEFCNKIFGKMPCMVEKMMTYEESKKEREKAQQEDKTSGGTSFIGENILLYGVPGAGKSHKIATEFCDNPDCIVRVVFHPDYTYSDFVGQILPRLKGKDLTYEFVPGPFTEILDKAYHDPGNMYYLIIEEINRGNAPAIFGEIFQLLDRKDDDKYSSSEAGESEYGIVNYDVAKKVYGDPEHMVKIPSNLTLIATMNTADQNVFTLDTAFQRRWDMEHIENDVPKAKHAHIEIQGTGVEWGDFAVVINDLIVEKSADVATSADKRLGAYFVKEKELQSDKFPEKVLKYLWDDAFKMDHDYVFRDDMNSLEKVISTYNSAETSKLAAVLRSDVYQKMLRKPSGNDVKTEGEKDE